MTKQNAMVALDPSKLDPNKIGELRAANYLVLSPSDQIAQINPFFAIRLSHVPVEFEVGEYNRVTSNHVWKVPGGGTAYAPTKVLLNKIASAAGIEWIVDQCRRVDNESDRKIVRYRAVGQIRLPSGEVKRFMDEATEDGYIVEEEILDKWLAKVGNQVDDWQNGKKVGKKTLTEFECREAARKEFRQYLKFIQERCLARAMNRAIRQVLALNGTYTLDELRKGFVVPQVNFSPDWSNPQIAAMAQEALAGKFAGIFNPGGETPALEAPAAAPVALPAPVADPMTGEVSGLLDEPADPDFERMVASAEEAVVVEAAPVISKAEAGEIAEMVEAVLVSDLAPVHPTEVEIEGGNGIKAGTLGLLVRQSERVFGTAETSRETALLAFSKLLDRELKSRKDLTEDEAQRILKKLEKTKTGLYAPKPPDEQGEEGL